MPSQFPEGSERIGAVLEFWGKAAGALMAVFLLVEKVGKPYFRWRQERTATLIREILKDELDCIRRVEEDHSSVKTLLLKILENQSMIFEDMDDFLMIAKDNRERHDETADLLDQQGLGLTERRAGADRRKNTNEHMDAVMEGIERRMRSRRRDVGEVPVFRASELQG